MSAALLQQWGENIRLMRKVRDAREGLAPEQGMRQMAAELGVSAATVSRWETGKSCPTDDHKIEIADYLGLPVRTVFPLGRLA